MSKGISAGYRFKKSKKIMAFETSYPDSKIKLKNRCSSCKTVFKNNRTQFMLRGNYCIPCGVQAKNMMYRASPELKAEWRWIQNLLVTASYYQHRQYYESKTNM